MTDYNQLLSALNRCADYEKSCQNCPLLGEYDCCPKLLRKAAKAIRELTSEKKAGLRND